MSLIQDKIDNSVDYLEARNHKPRTIKMSSQTRQMLTDELAVYQSFATNNKFHNQYRGLKIVINEDIPSGDVIISE